MTELKQNRWVKIHERGQANYVEKENVMDIMVGDTRHQAEVLFTVRSYKKAAEWILKYLESAKATSVVEQSAEKITAAVSETGREDPEMTVAGEHWALRIEKMSSEAYKVCMTWENAEQPEETAPVAKKKRGRKKKVEAEAVTA